MVLSQQTFPLTTAKYLNKVFVDDKTRHNSVLTNDVQQEFFDKHDDGKQFVFVSGLTSTQRKKFNQGLTSGKIIIQGLNFIYVSQLIDATFNKTFIKTYEILSGNNLRHLSVAVFGLV
jgi:hypothetical protein